LYYEYKAIKLYKQYQKIIKNYDTNVAKNIHKNHPMLKDIMVLHLRAIINRGDKKDYKTIYKTYSVDFKKLQGKKAGATFEYEMVDYERDLSELNFRKLDEKIDDLLAEYNDVVPEVHPKTIDALKLKYDLSKYEDRYVDGDSLLRTINKLEKELYGDYSPKYHMGRLNIADHYYKYTNKLDEIGETVDASLEGVLTKEVNPEHDQFMNSINLAAGYYELVDRFNEASERLDFALETAKSKYDKKDMNFGVQLDRTASLQLQLGQYDKAKYNIEEIEYKQAIS